MRAALGSPPVRSALCRPDRHTGAGHDPTTCADADGAPHPPTGSKSHGPAEDPARSDHRTAPDNAATHVTATHVPATHVTPTHAAPDH